MIYLLFPLRVGMVAMSLWNGAAHFMATSSWPRQVCLLLSSLIPSGYDLPLNPIDASVDSLGYHASF